MSHCKLIVQNRGVKMFVTNYNIHRAVRVMKRQVHSCSVMCNPGKKEAKIMAKLMTESYRKKKSWYRAEIMVKVPILPSNKKFQEGGYSKKRIDVLNKLFMRSITDLLATGEVAPYLMGYGLSITKVKVASDFSAVNVYWSAKGGVQTADFNKDLEKAGFELRHHLCQLHVMGKVPRICFIADKWQMIMEDTLNCLEKVQIKDGYMAEDLASKMKSENVLDVSLSPEEQAKIEELYDLNDNPLPPMTHNVLGLDHAAIMTKIERAVKKSGAKHRESSSSSDSITNLEDNVTDTIVNKHDIYPSDVSQYIAKQKIEKKKARRALQKELMAKMEVIENTNTEDYIDMEDGDFVEDFDITKHCTDLKE